MQSPIAQVFDAACKIHSIQADRLKRDARALVDEAERVRIQAEIAAKFQGNVDAYLLYHVMIGMKEIKKETVRKMNILNL